MAYTKPWSTANRFTAIATSPRPQTIPEALLDTLPEALHDTLLETIPEALLDTIPDTIPEGNEQQ